MENKSFEKLLIFLQGHGLSPKYATQIYRMYESHAVEKIKDNPYALYLDKVIDFPAAARLDDSLGYSSPESYRNQALLLGDPPGGLGGQRQSVHRGGCPAGDG